jgi:heme A synthase
MEFTFLSLAAAGGWLLWQRRPKKDEAHEEPGAQNGPSHNGRGEIRFIYLFLAAFLTFTAFLGWWATQVLYDQQVIYSYKALSETPPSTAPATSHSGAPR